jgi:hypothetical protein
VLRPRNRPRKITQQATKPYNVTAVTASVNIQTHSTMLFSMTEYIGTLHKTVKWYFAVALPVSFVSLGLAVILTLPSVLRWCAAWKKKFNMLFTSDTKKNN